MSWGCGDWVGVGVVGKGGRWGDGMGEDGVGWIGIGVGMGKRVGTGIGVEIGLSGMGMGMGLGCYGVWKRRVDV